jgi:LGFP repeat
MSAISEKFQLLQDNGIVLGNPTTEERDTPNKAGQYQEYEQGIIFYNPSFGACLLTASVTKKWKSRSVANTTAHNPSIIQDYLGFPTADTAKNNDGTEVCMFERGMIVCRTNGNSFVVYGDIFTKYLSVQGKAVGSPFPNWMGYPTQDVSVGLFYGLVGRFEYADIYWYSPFGAFEVHGSIRDRYNSLGQTASVLGYPISDEHDIMKGSISVGKANNFQRGAIYWSSKTGAWEIHGELLKNYSLSFEKLVVELGFPTSNQLESPLGKYSFNNFERGVLALDKRKVDLNKPDNSIAIRAIKKVAIIVTKLQTDEDDDDLHVVSFVTSKVNGRELERFSKHFGKYEDQGTKVFENPDEGKICEFTINDGNTIITLDMTAREIDKGPDDHIASFSKSFSIDTLWDASLPDLSGKNPDHFYDGPDGKFRAYFKVDKLFKIEPKNFGTFRKYLWWDILNYGVDRMSREVYAATFSDVEEEEFTPLNLFNAILFEAVYKSLGGPGVCFGMCAEAAYALKGRSISDQPISQYNSQLNNQFGVTKKDVPFPDPARNNSFQLMHGYQLSSELVRYYISQLVDGELWNPVQSFYRSEEMFHRGDYPIIALSKNTGISPGHAVLPYHWIKENPDKNGVHTKLTMYVADPNRPFNEDGKEPSLNPLSVITIYNEPGRIEFKFVLGKDSQGNDIIWSGREGAFKGGRMFPIPYSKFSAVPSTPYLEVGVALIAALPVSLFLGGPIAVPLGLLSAITGGALILFGNTTDADQITDGNGRKYFEEDDDSIIYDPNQRIDNFAHVPVFSGPPIPKHNVDPAADAIDMIDEMVQLQKVRTKKPHFYLSQSPINNGTIYSAEGDKATLLSGEWSYPHLLAAIKSETFWADTNLENVEQQFAPEVARNILELRERGPQGDALHFAMANRGEDYVWTMATRHAKFKIDTNSVAGNSDKITIEDIHTSGQALTFVPNDAQEGKTLKTSITNHNNSLMFVLENINVAAGSPITFQHSNGGSKVLVYTSGAPMTADVTLFYENNESGSIQMGNTVLPPRSITTFEAISTTVIKKEVYTQLGGAPTSSMSNISLDCRSLGHDWLILIGDQTGAVPSPTDPSANGYFRARNRIVNFFLEDGRYNVTIQSGNPSIVNFTVKDGIISYDAELEGVISGAGTSALVLHGLPVTIDATEVQGFITYMQVVYGLEGFETSNANRPFFTGNLLPNCHDSNDGWEYWFIIASGMVASFTFKVQLNGLFTYKPEFDNSVTGRGTNMLKISSFTPRA